MTTQRLHFLWSTSLLGLLTIGLPFGSTATADIITYEFSGAISSNLGASPFADGEAFRGLLSIDLDTSKSSEGEGPAGYDNAIVSFGIEFSGGLRVDHVAGGGISINTNFVGTHLVLFNPVSEETLFSNSTRAFDAMNLSFWDNTASSLTSTELVDLPENFDGFAFFREFRVEHLGVAEDLQYRSTGVIDTFNVTAVPEPSGVLLCSVVALGAGIRRRWRRRSSEHRDLALISA